MDRITDYESVDQGSNPCGEAMRDRHKRRFRTLLWDGLRENWTGWEPGDDDAPRVESAPRLGSKANPHTINTVYVDVAKIGGHSEYSKYSSFSMMKIPEYAEWSDEHHKVSSDIYVTGKFVTVDDEDLEHLPV
jgi:hypothetical protein